MGKDLFNDRISRFSIRKLNVGVCSVLLGTLVIVGTASQVSADETANQVQAGDVASTTATVSDETSSQNAVAAQASTEVANFLSISETNSQSQTVSNASAATSETSTTQASSETTSQAATSTSATTAASTTSVAGSTSVGNTTGVSTTASVTPASSETTASETASEAQGVDVQAEASTTNALSSGAEASALEQPVVTAETSGRRRTRRAIGDPNDESLIGDDVEDATSTPKVEKPTEFSKINAKELVKQINWLDFGDTTAWTNTTTSKDGRTALQVGSTYTKEIMPGYIVNIKVKSLKPFQATEIYKNRMEAQGATEAEKATYDPNAKNGYIGTIGDPTTRAAFANREEALVVADAQNRWTEIRQEGIDTGSKRTTISSEYNGANIGVQFEISATFRGKSVKPAVVAADGESANPGELVLFTTNGAGWKHIGEWKKASNTETYVVQDTHNYFDPANNYSRSKFVDVNGARISGLNLELLRNANEVGPDKKPVAWKYFGSPDQVTGGLGTGVFGPNVSASRFSVPLVMTQGASEVGLYIASSGKQSAMLGFFPLDEGDAPESYGKAQHSIGTVDGVTGTKLAQPYLGTVSPDMDENNANDWTGDDNTISADEGVDQIVPDNLKGQTNDMIKLDRTRPGTYTLDVEAHTDGAAKAYVYGWIDFNQNGTFDEDERSDLATVTKDGTVRLEFRNAKTMIDPSVTELGTRVRIASNQSDIENPTGLALSGEVEDFKTQITFPPKGERKETIDVQGATQTATVAFTAQGLSKYSRDKNAEIDQTVAPVIIDNRTKQVVNPKADGYYVIPGEGKYKITPNGNNVDIEFTPEDNFVGTASGISIRRTDDNGYTTDWVSKDKTLLPSINEVMDNMDGLYIPTVTPKNIEGEDKKSTDVQGASQTGTPEFALEGTNSNGEKVKITPDFDYPAKFVDPATGNVINDPVLTVEGEGIYYLDELTGKVTFVPEPGFTGTAKGVTVSLTAPVGRDKDGRVPDNALKTATAKYTPTATPITVTPTDKVSEDVQNVPQTQTPTFELSNDKAAKITSKKMVDPATGQPTDETTVTVAGEGTYTIDPTTGAVTFTPEKDFVGTAKGVTVQATATITNANGKTAIITSDAKYTPTVVPAVPTESPATSKDIQGATQTGTPSFAGTTVQVNGEDKAITIKDNSYTLLDSDGNEVTSTPAYAADGTTEIGTYSIDSATGQVTFTPTDKSYTGAVTPAKVQAESSNGIKVDTTYTPEIVPVTPTATPAETTDIQGATQTGKPEFKGGTVTVDGVEKTVAINEAVPATFDDGSTTKSVDGVGTYTVAADGTVTFVPEPSFTGTAPAVTVVREDKNGTKASATYTPSVTPITVTPTDKVSADVQNVPQTQTPTFDLSNDKTAEITSKKLVDPATGQPTDETTVTVAGEGSYTIDPTTGAVTFTPEKDFVGTAKGVTVQATATITNANGKTATITSDATYTPTVVPAVPTANPATSKDVQGATQTGTPTFAGTTVQVNGEDKAITIKDNSYTLLDNDGNEVTSTPAYAADGTTEIGTYSIDSATGQVTFTPTDKSYTGVVTPAKVQAESSNGIKVDTTYTPEIVPVTPTATPAETEDIQGATQTGKPEFKGGTVTVDGVEKTVEINEDVPATFDDGSTTKTVDGVGTYTVAADGTVTFVPEKSFVGTAPAVTVVREDKNGTKASATYTPTVTPVTPTATPVETTDIQGATQTGKPVFTEGDSRVPMNDDVPATFDDGSTTKSVDGVGTYTVAADGTVTFVPEPSFTGTAPAVTVVREDKNGTKASATYTPSVTPITVTPTDKVSADIQNIPQTQTPTFDLSNDKTAEITSKKLVDPATGQPTDETTVTVAGEGSYTIDPTTGAVTFTPEKDFVGTAKGVTVQATATITNANGKTATITSDATYTPTVVAAVPTAQPATSKDVQGATQTGTPTFAGTTVQVNGEDKAITIKDNSYTLLDNDGNEVTSTPAYAADGTTEIGTYSIDSATGQVTFTPTDKSYTGVVTPAKVQAESSNGIKVDTTYTPEIVPITPTATPAETTDIQGATQTGKPEFKGGTVTVDGVEKTVAINEDVPATFDDGSTTKTVDGVGTYTVAADGTVTFVPEKSFVGTAPAVTVVREDKNGTKASATYTPTVTPVTPTAEDTTSTGKQGQTQTGKPEFTEGDSRVPMNDDVPATFEDGSTTKTVDGVGTYTVAADGTVTFVPEKSFTGTAPAVTVVREDKNGTKASATYTPTVTPVTPTATPAESTGPQGLVQTGTVTFTEGDEVAPINKDSITLLDETGQPAASVEAKSPAGDVIGTFTVDKETGVVTFTPTDKSYSGDVVPVKVQAADTNGTTVETTYTPKITPVVPTSEDATTTDIQGATQTGKPTFTEGDPNVPIDEDTPATFEDGSTTKTVDGEGTYTVSPDGTVTFVPEKSFTGTASGVTVKRVDKNGTEITAKYTPTVTPVTPTATPVETTGKQGQTQTGKPEFTEGDSRVPMNDDVPATFDDGSTTKTVDGVGTYTVAADGTVTFVPEKSFTGKAPAVTVVREDKNGTKASATYTPTVTPVTPTATPAESTGPQGLVQTGTVTFTEGDPVAPIDKDTITLLDETGQPAASVEAKSPAGDVIGTFTVDKETGVVTFTPTDKSYSGDVVPVKVQAADTNGTTVETTYTPKITPVVPTSEDATSTDIQGATQSGKPTFTEGNPNVPIDEDTPATFEDGSTTKTVDGEGTYTVSPDGTVTFVPEKSFTGTASGVTVKRVDKNGTEITAKYTPTVTPVTPTATPVETTDIQGATQTGKPVFTEGDSRVPMNDDVPATFDDGSTTKTVDGVGTYTVAADGTVTFVPEKSFVGTAPAVTVVREDKNGTKASATYTPTVTPVTPTAEDTTSTDKQGQTQTGTPTFTPGNPNVPMDDDTPATFEDGSTTKTVPGEGTYTVAPDGTVTFVPEKSFTGEGTGVTVKRVDKNGTPVTAKYTPTVTPVTPTATPAESEAPQGVVQTGTVTFTEGDPVAPIDKDTITLLDENGQPAESVVAKSPEGKEIGTFTVDKETGVVTFTPTDKSYSGDVVPVKVQAADTNGTTVETTYTPKITPVVPTAEPVTSTDIQGKTQTGTPSFTPGNPAIPMDDDVPATFEDGSTTKVIPGEGTYTVAPDGTVTFVPEKSFTGEGTGVTVKRVDKNGTPATAKYTPTVTPVTPTATPVETTGKQGQTQTGKPEFTEGDSRVPMNDDVPATFDDGSTTKTVDGVGTYTVAADGTVTFVPEKSFTGTAPAVTVVREDKNGTKASATYTPTVTPVTPTATPAESTGPQGVVQTGTVTFTEGDSVAPIDKDTITLLDENGQPAAAVFAKSPAGDIIGTFTVDKETGVVTFTPTDKSYSGDVVPVKVQAADTNGTTVETTYTPKITPVVPTSEDATSTDIQGQTQSGKPTFTEGNPNVPIDEDTPATFEDGSTTKTVEGVGTYTVAADGTVTFVPEKSFTGTATGVTVKRVDKNGTEITAKYTPTVTPVTPTATPTTSTDIQGATQTGKLVFTEGDSRVPMNDDVPATFDDGSTTKSVDGVGTYTVAADGTVTFVPEKSFVGTAPAVTVVREDINGTKASATYTPTVTPVTPTAEPATSTDIQGATQTGKPTFTEGDSRVPMNDDVPATFDDGSTTKTVDGVGTYTVAADGTVTFVPEKSFVGEAPAVTVVREDKNGTKASATYTPTVTPVTPTSEPATSTDIQGQTQTGKPSFTPGNPSVPMDDDVPATFEDGSTTKVIPGEGTYTVAPDGTVTFVPEKSFVGTAPAVTVVREDKNGTKASATYTPTVTPVTPTAEPATSTDIQGATQTGKPTFTEGDSRVPMNDDVPATFDDGSTTKTVDGVGTYTVAADGTVTFVPEKSFVGEAPAVTVVREDKNGTKASATYTPTVTPVTPTAAPATSTDIQGQTQTGKPSFMSGNPSVPMDDDVPATFDDGSTTKVIPGEGTYTVSPDGTVTFVPEKAFTGTGTGVTVKRVDKNGTAITATYTPTVTPVTPTAESVTSIGNKGQTQTGKPSFTEGDSRVPMNNQVPATFEDGSTTKTISGVGTYTVAADGTVTFTPEPEFTGTAPAVTVVREDVNGTKASATYTPTVLPITKFVDKEGKEIPGYPTVDGEQPKVEIPGYRFVETKKLPNGDIEHVYEQVTTSYVDENGTPIPGYPTEDGQQPKKDIPGYEFVKTVVDENGNTQHIYKQIVTPTPVPDTTPTPEPQPAPQTEEPKAPVLPETKEEAHFINPTDKTAQLPETGSEDSNLAIFGLASLLAGFGLYGTKRRKR
ncbi:GEVED domain-containing protein [Streptococcus salivarius]|uniref:CshA family fibrillar surface protein C n=6 Tax=Streptococcus TaxID=1301 RepID=A0A074IRK2_STRSL|nr:GEVED domain-containing protein [Streptococcus salivarius]KEO43491.1 CshA family fibrillar surface protein C [Streptococcus salivarius]KEO46266.1 CshA family fibrillar surface protein C [Streptococcus salivarius]